jgi:hypothetical protein
LNFDSDGDLVVPVDGSGVETAEVILLDSSIEQDSSVEEALNEYRKNLVNQAFIKIFEVLIIYPRAFSDLFLPTHWCQRGKS